MTDRYSPFHLFVIFGCYTVVNRKTSFGERLAYPFTLWEEKDSMRKLVVLFLVIIWILTACAGPSSPADLPATGTEEAQAARAEMTAEPVVETPAVQTAAVTEAAASEATTAPQEGISASGTVVYSLMPEESKLTYEVGETFIEQGNVFNVAVGTTSGVTGEVQVNFDDPQQTTLGTMTVDVSGFTSDSGRRDNAIRERFLQSSQFPTVTFTPTVIEGLPETIESGLEYPLTIQGDLTVRDTTKPASFDATVTWQDDALTGQALTTILMSDYGFGPISILNMLETQDEVKILLDFVARPT
jgi:polyisoprenoid-binding protein YceI